MVRELIRVVYIWSSLLQLTRDLSQAEKKYCCYKLSKVTKWQLFLLTLVLGEKNCQFVNVLSLLKVSLNRKQIAVPAMPLLIDSPKERMKGV